MNLNRRRFLGFTGSAVGSVATGGLLWKIGTSQDVSAIGSSTSASSSPTVAPTTTGPSTTVPATVGSPAKASPTTTTPTTVAPTSEKRVVVLVQMAGGNDVLNTLVPADGRYRDARPTLAIDDADVVPLDGITSHGFHPALAPLVDMWSDDQLAVVQGLALPEQSRSHFVALDTWWTATPELASSGGWIGRYLDATVSDEAIPIRAVSLGGGAPALTGIATRPVIVQRLEGFVLRAPRRSSGVSDAFSAMAAGPSADGLLGAAQAAIPTAVDSVDTLQTVFDSTPQVDVAYEIEELFHAAASIIEADIGTEVILINAPGFDTHSDQLARHIELLGGIANGIEALYSRLSKSGYADRTVTLAYSEFGRRVAENGSGGTDHGHGGIAFVAGPAVAGRQLVGDADLVNLDHGDLVPNIDTRSVYADVLDWIGAPSEQILGGRFDTYSLLAS